MARATWRAAAVVAAALSLLLPAGAVAAPAPVKEHGPLSPALTQLAKPAVRLLPQAKQARILGVAPSGPGSLIRRGNRVLVYVRHEAGAGTLPALREQGARVIANSRPLQTATAAVSAADLPRIARAPGVLAVTQVRAPVLRAACNGGSVISEGVNQLNVAAAREEFEVDGEGVEVGVLSDSFDQATESVPGGPIASDAQEDEETGDLPGPESPCATQKTAVDELQPYEFFEDEESFDEGRGMLQIVHDVAPEADLAFHSAFNGELDFAAGIEDLAAAGADVIVDDVGYFEEPFFQDGPVAVAVNTVSEEGNTYLSSAGNDNLFDGEGNEIASWEAPAYRDSGDCPPEVRALSSFNATHCLDFNPGAATDRTFGIRVEAEETLTLDLQWAEPWFGVENDLDAFLLDDEGELLTASFEDNASSEKKGGTQRPLEILQWENPTSADQVVQLVVNQFAGTGEPRLKFVLLQNGGGVTGVEYPRSGGGDVVGPTIYGHAAAASAIAVGAVPFNDSSQPEEYSSRGPATHYFGPVAGKKPAPELLEPEVLSKPEVAATDCGRTTFFARQSSPGVWRFCGTSAAAPHAAGVAALLLDEESGSSPEEVRDALAASASAVGSFGPCAVGGGLIEAEGALEAIEGTPFPAPDPCEPPDASGAVFVAPGDWGSESPPEPPDNPVTPTPQPPLPPQTRVAPATAIAKHPRATVRTRGSSVRLVFGFRSDQADAGFLCNVDRAGFKPCAATLARRFRLGRHLLKVKARGATGLVDQTPAIFRFRVIAVASPNAR